MPDFTVMEDASRTIAVLSGKGGAGKTMVAVNLAAVAERAVYVDCDVEEPNGHLFLQPEDIHSTAVQVAVPVIDYGQCSECRKCIDFCRFNALAMANSRVLVFEEICHACGGCRLVCPEQAIDEKQRTIGWVQRGRRHRVSVITGVLNAGESTGVPIIRETRKQIPSAGTVIMDCPPGSGCSVMESIQEADYCILVAEPTVFSRANLAMVHELVKLFHKPAGVILNKVMGGENPSERYATDRGIAILGRIDYDRELARLHARARIASQRVPKYNRLFRELLQNVLKEASRETSASTQR